MVKVSPVSCTLKTPQIVGFGRNEVCSKLSFFNELILNLPAIGMLHPSTTVASAICKLNKKRFQHLHSCKKHFMLIRSVGINHARALQRVAIATLFFNPNQSSFHGKNDNSPDGKTGQQSHGVILQHLHERRFLGVRVQERHEFQELLVHCVYGIGEGSAQIHPHPQGQQKRRS